MKIVVVGGVAAGASAAARARRLSEDAEIVVLERDRYVSFANCGLPYHISGDIPERDALLIQTPENLRAALNLDIRIQHDVISIDRDRKHAIVIDEAYGRTYEEPYDKLIVASGAAPLRPSIPGVDSPRVHVLRTIPDMDGIIAELETGAHCAVVVGGSYIGIETAEALRIRGLETHVVEMLDQVVPFLDHEMARELQYHMESHGVGLHLGTAAERFGDIEQGIEVSLSDGITLVADFVVLAVGVRPEARLAKEAGLEIGRTGGIVVDQHQRTSDLDIYAAGDTVEVTDTVTGEPAVVALAGPANRQGRIAADHIFGRPNTYRSTQGTALLKVFEMTAGVTGPSEAVLREGARPYRKIYLHPSGHASYYPGTRPMHLKLLFEPESGAILGAQAVGYDGVDKRIDVLATALRSGLTVFDLEDLELGYAPPYGSAKDPVNMAGFVAGNALRGDVEFWFPENWPDQTSDGLLLDVRSPLEFDTWHIEGALNIPLRELREHLDEIPAEMPIFVYCRSGVRSYLAYRLLRQQGFDVATLAGGTKTFQAFHRTPLSTGRPGIPVVAHAEDDLAALPGALDNA